MTDLTAERTRKLAAEAQLAEMELAKARHEYVGVTDVAGAWSEVLSAVRGRCSRCRRHWQPLLQMRMRWRVAKRLSRPTSTRR